MKGYFKALLMTLTLILAALVTTNWTSQPAHATGPWYVAPGGDDANPCNSPDAPCRSIDAVLGKDGFVAGDTIFVASGTYTGSGEQVVTLENSTSLSGGWNPSFTAQDGFSVVDGEFARGGMTVGDVSVRVERFVFQNGYTDAGGGIYGNGDLTLDHCTIAHNTSTLYGGGVAVANDRKLVIRFSAVYGNSAIQDGGGIYVYGSLVVDNTTVSGNTAGGNGGGIYGGSTTLNSTTVSGNAAASGGGLISLVVLRNTILAGNTAATGPDCLKLVSVGYNLIGNTAGCDYTAGPGDLTGVDPHFGRLVSLEGHPRYNPLLSGSPAIDAGDPAGCFGSEGLLSTDQRGAARVGRCDIGAYEYTPPGPAATIYAHSGTPQRTSPLLAFGMPLQAAVLDGIGSPVNNATVAFSAPASGPSGTFTDTGALTTTAISDLSGIATAAMFTANELTGSYVVTATVDGVMSYGSFLLTNTKGWYVAPGGNDSHSCLLPDVPCATINSAIGKATPGDEIFVAQGVYTGTGYQVVLILKDIVLSGGWNATFTSQNGVSTIDGQGARIGIWIIDANATIERFMVRNGYSEWLRGAIANSGTTTLSDSTISANTSCGIDNGGVMAVNNSTISDNKSSGIWNEGGTLVLNSSTVSGNWSNLDGGGINNRGTMTLNNCTVSDNTGGAGGGAQNTGTLYVNNSIFYDNSAGVGGGIYVYNGAQATIRNSILAGNSAGSSGPDCEGSMSSGGYNLIGDASGCTFTPGPGDVTGVSPYLGPLIGATGLPRYHPLLSGSPAIDAGNPAGCADHLGNPLGTDQRGAARVGRCDIGAYEYVTPGPAASVHANGGTPQRTPPFSPFMAPLQAVVLDGIGSPVSNTTVSFYAPASGPSGAFADTGTFTTTAVTNEAGVAPAPILTANALTGTYTVTATVGGIVTPASFLLENIGWYVCPSGNDNDDCLSAPTACATINGALAKPGFIQGDSILVASGTYTGTDSKVVLLNKDAVLSGGWNASFTMQSGVSTIDGEGTRQGIVVNAGVTAFVERFSIQNGPHNDGAFDYENSGVANEGTLTLNNSTVSGGRFLGIANHGTLIVNNATVTSNTHGIYNLAAFHVLVVNNSTISSNGGHGIVNDNSTLTVNSSTVSANADGGIVNYGTMALNSSTISGNRNGGIVNYGTMALNSSTITRNSGDWYGGGILGSGSTTLRNTIVAGNTANAGAPDCASVINSAGYNLIGDTSGCTFVASTGDLLNVDPRLWPFLLGSPAYHPLLPGSPAINAGNPAGCTDHLGNPLDTDQRGVPRLGRCDIGSYEYDPAYDPLTHTFLPVVARNYCPDFFDDFSNPASGWEVGEDEYVRSEYLNGEYRVRTKQSGYVYLFRAPTCDRQNYMVEADARWVGTPGASYGLIFGTTGDFSQFYLFEVNTDYQQYWLLRGDPSGWVSLVDPTDSPAIHSGTASNHLKVSRNDSQITLEVNGTVLGTWQDSTTSGLTGVGLASSPYDDAPVSDARFDNFRVTSLTSGMMQQSLVNTSAEAEGSQVIPVFPKVVTFNNQ